jgi:hypothetical protein
MRKALPRQSQLDCPSVSDLTFNVNCRDEIIPILLALQHVYSDSRLRSEILRSIESDVNGMSSADMGRTGMDYWQILVLMAVRLGCDYDYDHLQNLAEEHRSLRRVMRIGDWLEESNFSWRTIRNNICLLQPQTVEAISHAIVDLGHQLEPDAAQTQRADSTVVDTNIHFPTESSLIWDGTRKITALCVQLHDKYEITGWRQFALLLRQVKKVNREIGRIVGKKGANYKERLAAKYRELLRRARSIIDRAKSSCETLEADFVLDLWTVALIEEVRVFIGRTEQVCGTARRRVLEGETVPNADKLFSVFEPHTQLYRRGKAGEPNQYGRLVMFYEDAAGFITHHHLLERDQQDADIAVEQTRALQERLNNKIESLSFDRGFHSPENHAELAKLVPNVCLPMPGPKQSASQNENATPIFNKQKKSHSGIESAIGALKSGNGLERCRDSSEQGFKRYLALAVLGRNLHTLGRLLLARTDPDSAAAHSERHAA